jgi:hypothetical protein
MLVLPSLLHVWKAKKAKTEAEAAVPTPGE